MISEDWGLNQVKKLYLLIICVLMFSLTGCMKKYPLSETGTDTVAEYMAGLLLKYDRKYSESLLSYQEIDQASDSEAAEVETKEAGKVSETESPKANEEKTGKVSSDKEDGGDNSYDENRNNDNVNSEGNVIEYTLSEVIGDQNFDIQYVGYRTLDAYPEDETNHVFSIDPKEGCQLFEVDFSIENLTEKDKIFDLTGSNLKYRLNINNENSYRPQSVLLENNLQFIKMNIKAGKTISAVLVFEIPKDIDLSKIDLNFYKDAMTGTINIK